MNLHVILKMIIETFPFQHRKKREARVDKYSNCLRIKCGKNKNYFEKVWQSEWFDIIKVAQSTASIINYTTFNLKRKYQLFSSDNISSSHFTSNNNTMYRSHQYWIICKSGQVVVVKYGDKGHGQ